MKSSFVSRKLFSDHEKFSKDTQPFQASNNFSSTSRAQFMSPKHSLSHETSEEEGKTMVGPACDKNRYIRCLVLPLEENHCGNPMNGVAQV